MLAGKMKLNHFLMIAGVVGIAGIVGLYYACSGGDDGPDYEKLIAEPRTDPPSNDDRPTPTAPEPTAPEPTVPEPTAPVPADDGMRPVDRDLMSWHGKNLGSGKIKDATKGRPYKINVYQDDGNSVANRAKIDLDRDDKWDEKITFDGPNISRKVAPADDENYTEEYDWDGSAWVAR